MALEAGSYYQMRRAQKATDAQIAREWMTYLAGLDANKGSSDPAPAPAPAPAPDPPASPPSTTPSTAAGAAHQALGSAIPDSQATADDVRSSWSVSQYKPNTTPSFYNTYKANQAGVGGSIFDRDFTAGGPGSQLDRYRSYGDNIGRGSNSSSSDSTTTASNSTDQTNKDRPDHYGRGWRSTMAEQRKAGGDEFFNSLVGLRNDLARGLS